MTITFKHPSIKSQDKLKDFQPWNPEHYPDKKAKGIYIYGIRIYVDGQLKFVPVVVGEGDLFKRLFNDHYCGKFKNPYNLILGKKSKKSKDSKEMWDFSRSNYQLDEIKNIYLDLHKYDKAPKLGLKKLPIIGELKHLIYYQDINYFNKKYKIEDENININLKIEQSISHLINLSSKSKTDKSLNINNHISKIIGTLSNFEKNFYYTYAEINETNIQNIPSKEVYRQIEYMTKQELQKLNITTTAIAHKGKLNLQIKIELGEIKNELIQLL